MLLFVQILVHLIGDPAPQPTTSCPIIKADSRASGS